MTGDRCVVCGAGTHRPADACARCKRILDRVETRRDASGGLRRADAAARLRALAGSWRDGAFRCFYTGVSLVEDHSRWRDHRYLVFEDRIPGDGASVVVTCALVSRMKADLTEDQFKLVVTELAKVFNGGTFDQGAFPDQGHAGMTRPPACRLFALGPTCLLAELATQNIRSSAQCGCCSTEYESISPLLGCVTPSHRRARSVGRPEEEQFGAPPFAG